MEICPFIYLSKAENVFISLSVRQYFLTFYHTQQKINTWLLFWWLDDNLNLWAKIVLLLNFNFWSPFKGYVLPKKEQCHCRTKKIFSWGDSMHICFLRPLGLPRINILFLATLRSFDLNNFPYWTLWLISKPVAFKG